MVAKILIQRKHNLLPSNLMSHFTIGLWEAADGSTSHKSAMFCWGPAQFLCSFSWVINRLYYRFVFRQ